jgi:hypothetical protein
MLTLLASVRVFVARSATDLRRSFDWLSAQVQEGANAAVDDDAEVEE